MGGRQHGPRPLQQVSPCFLRPAATTAPLRSGRQTAPSCPCSPPHSPCVRRERCIACPRRYELPFGRSRFLRTAFCAERACVGDNCETGDGVGSELSARSHLSLELVFCCMWRTGT